MEYINSTQISHYKRFCKVLSLRADDSLISEYKKAHAPQNIWPEISQGMKSVGILYMEIYISGTTLFMIMDTVPDFDHEKAMKELANKPRQSEWEKYMSKFQNSLTDTSAADKWICIERIFRMNE